MVAYAQRFSEAGERRPIQKALAEATKRPRVVPTRRQVLSAVAGAGLTGLAGCLDRIGDALPEDNPTTTHRECSATAPPQPDPGEGLPDPRSFPEGPPEFTDAAVTEFVEQYERAFTYNAMLAEFIANGHCLEYLEIYVVGNETTVEETDRGFTAQVTTQGSYTGTACPTETGTDTPTGVPHVDLPKMPAQYLVTERELAREGSVYQCW